MRASACSLWSDLKCKVRQQGGWGLIRLSGPCLSQIIGVKREKRDFPIWGDKNWPCSWQRVGVTAERFRWSDSTAWEGDPGAPPTETGSPLGKDSRHCRGRTTLQKHLRSSRGSAHHGYPQPYWQEETGLKEGVTWLDRAGPGPPRCMHCCGCAGPRGGMGWNHVHSCPSDA